MTSAEAECSGFAVAKDAFLVVLKKKVKLLIASQVVEA